MLRTRYSILALIFVIAAGAVFIADQALFWRGAPILPVGFEAMAVILILALVLGYLGRQVQRVKAKEKTFLTAIGAARVAAAALAATHGSALMAGAFAGGVVYILTRMHNEAIMAGLWSHLAGAFAALILAGVGLWVESVCAIDPPDNTEGRAEGRSPSLA